MRHLALALGSVLSLTLAAPALSAERGRIEGRVINGTTGAPQPRVEVTLTRGRGNARSQQTIETDARGRYVFDNLRTGDNIFYVVDATYRGGLFAGRPLSLPDDTERKPVIETTLRVFEPTTDPNAILIRRNDLFLVHDADRISVIESVKVVNPTKSAYIGRGSALGGGGDEPTPSLGFALPDGVIPESFQWLDADLDLPEAVEIEGIGFGITSAIPPGELDFTFSYQMEGTGGNFDLTRRALYEISEMSVFAAPPLSVDSNRLEERGTVDLEGTEYRRFSTTESLDAADPVQILAIAETDSAPPLLMGLAAGLAALAGVAFFGFRRSKKSRATTPARAAQPAREDLVTAIAELDLRFESGAIAEAEYRQERARLKARVGRTDADPS
jgi:hypothetical protein